MKILHTADWHLGKKLDKFSRYPEQIQILSEICDIADQQDVDAIIIAGDLFDTFNPPTEAIELFYKTLKRLSNHGQRAVIALAGNHDSADRIAAPDPLARMNGIIMVGHHDAKVPPFELETGLAVTRSDEGFLEIKLPNKDYPLRLILTPYVNELRLKRELVSEDKELEFRKILTEHWKMLAQKYCDHKGVNILATHLFVVEKGKDINLKEETEDEKPILHVGGAQAIYSNDIPKNIQYVALGHLHRQQVVANKPCPIVYSSSPLAYSFSEANQDKYIMLIQANPNILTFERIHLTNGRRLLRHAFSDIDLAVKWLEKNPNSFVELTIQSESYLTSLEKSKLYAAHDGITRIIPQLTDNEGIVHSKFKTIDISKNTEQLFIDYFQHENSGQEPNQELLDLFKELQV